MALTLNRAVMTTTTTGTGTVTLGEAVIPFQSLSAASAVNGQTYGYLIEDANGAWEIGSGVYTSSGTTLSRNVTQSTNSNALVVLSGAARVTILERSQDLWVPPLTILQRTTNQSITSSTNTDVSWDTSPLQDDVGAFSAGTPTQVTVPSGFTRVRITYYGAWAANNAGARFALFLKNAVVQGGYSGSANAESPHGFTTRWLTVAATDILKIQVSQQSGGNLNFVGATNFFTQPPYVQFEWAP